VAWSVLWDETRERLSEAGVATAEVDARRIIEQATGSDPARFHTVLSEPATVRGVAALDAMVARRLAGEPLQYVVGRWGFRHLDLMVDRRVLIPRPETEVVAGLAIEEVVARSGNGREVLVADLGTGSGAIALSLAYECESCRVLACDQSDDALSVARANLAGLGQAARRVTLHRGSWFDALPLSVRGSLDVVVANPPYVADDEPLPDEVENWEPREALRAGPRGDEDLVHLIDGADQWVRPGGALVMEMAPHQTAVMARRCDERGWRTTVHQDLAGRDRAVVARWVS